jgi:uncharacterized repeat protein (TIGR03803 family)
MQDSPNLFRSRNVVFLVAFILMLTLAASAQAQSVEIIHTFNGNAGQGSLPYSGLTEDGNGNYYGTTFDGGTHSQGTVYRLSPTSSGGFTETILYSFKGGTTDGAEPHSSLFRDSAGNLYGTTVTGGIVANSCTAGPTFANPIGCGVIFKLTPTSTGQWTETVLHRFSGTDGGNSFTGLVRDAAGNFYGVTIGGGSHALGAVFKLSLTSTGWKEIVLHNFSGGADGAYPFIQCATLAIDASGNLYGSTYNGGAANAGIVFKLSPPAAATSTTWTEKILYAFKGGSDGSEPFSGVILDESGNVYGTTSLGGTGGLNGGIVFKLTAANGYAKTVLHNFNRVTDPAEDFPNAVTFDAQGNLWGLTEYALFKLSPGTGGSWSETFVFNWQNTPGWSTAFTPLIIDSHGVIWGTDTWGANAFKVVP